MTNMCLVLKSQVAPKVYSVCLDKTWKHNSSHWFCFFLVKYFFLIHSTNNVCIQHFTPSTNSETPAVTKCHSWWHVFVTSLMAWNNTIPLPSMTWNLHQNHALAIPKIFREILDAAWCVVTSENWPVKQDQEQQQHSSGKLYD